MTDKARAEACVMWSSAVRRGANGKGCRMRSWTDSSAVKSTWFSCRGPKLGFQHTHGGSPPFLTPVPGDAMRSSDLYGHGHAQDAHTYIQNENIQINENESERSG